MVIVVALGAANSLAQVANSAPDISDLLPADATIVDVMELRAPARMVELTKKMQEAVAKDPDWWRSHLAKAKPGEPLSYDVRTGWTKSEYEDFLSLRSKMTVVKVNTAKVRVKRDEHQVVISFGEQLSEFGEVVLDTKSDTVTTPFGVAGTRIQISATEKQQATGPWEGIQWKLERVDEESGISTLIKFSLGKLKDNGRGILVYDAKQIGEKSKSSVFHLLQYELKAIR